jgi:(p)ppGpp synthase/HD superfamily hydrolase
MGDPVAVRLSERFDRAVLYAIHVHGGQVRKGTTIPYVAHLFGVAALVLEDGGQEDEAIAALLHDAMEDQGGRPRLDDIRGRFGEAVAGIVEACTDAETIPKPEWRERKRKYLHHLREVTDPAVLRVATADKVHNARAILADVRRDGVGILEKFNGKASGTLWYYACLVDVLGARKQGGLTEELGRVVRELRELAAAGSRGPGSP